MSKVFISYRHVNPDADLAAALDASLRARGLATFLDSRMPIGTEWAKEIEQQLRSCRFFVVLLSEESIRSAMMRQEIELAHRLMQSGAIRILPIRVGLLAELPYDLAAYLSPIQYAIWEPSTAPDRLVQDIVAAIERDRPPRRSTEDGTRPNPPRGPDVASAGRTDAPLPAADPRLETGSVRADSPFYVRREADDDVERSMLTAGSTIIVKGPRQVGKSSLIARALKRANERGQHGVYVDFQLVDEKYLRTLGDVFWYLAGRMSRALSTHLRPADVWNRKDDSIGEKEGITEFIREAVLADKGISIVLVVDEVDRLFNREYRDDFFATVRGWHNYRAIDDRWIGLNLLLAHAIDPALWIGDLNQSPFNVGDRVRLHDFTSLQVRDLNARHGSPLKTDGEIESLMDLVGGHPYLVRHALYLTSVGKSTLEELVHSAADDQGPFGDHLRSRLWSLRDNTRLQRAIADVIRDGTCADEYDFQALVSGGFICGDSRDRVEMRCELYRQYFLKHV